MRIIAASKSRQGGGAPFRLAPTLKGLLPVSARYQWRFYRIHKRLCNFRNPITFSEKIYHRMRYPLPDFTRLTDKLLVRDHVREAVGDAYNVPLLLATDRLTLAHFEQLPESFVMKGNNGCGQVRIVRNKHEENLIELTRLANGWLREDFARLNGERHYAGIRPCVLFEQALLAGSAPVPDYKVHVFNGADGGSYEFVQVINDRFGSPTQNLFDSEWQGVAFSIGGRLPPSDAPEILAPPPCLSEMLRIARVLAQPFGYCRVDLYVYQGRPYVGELTFTPGAGELRFTPREWDRRLGALFRWPEFAQPLIEPVTTQLSEAG
jgi:hypothetical protein